jgi:hypothetical protein
MTEVRPRMTKVRAHHAPISSNRARKLKFECPVCGGNLDVDYKNKRDGSWGWVYDCFSCRARLTRDEYNAALRDHDVYPSKILSGDFSELRSLGPERDRGGEPAALPTVHHIGGWHSRLLAEDEALDYLTCVRGLTVETIKGCKLGWDRDAETITLPVYDAAGQIVNLRRRKLGKGEPFKGLYGRGVQLYPLDVLTGEGLLCVAEGEFDCLLLNQSGLRSVTSTGGAPTWKPEWTPLLHSHEVAVIYDVDAELRSAELAEQFLTAGIDAWQVRLSSGGFRGKRDITDALVGSGKSAEWLRDLIRRERSAAC